MAAALVAFGVARELYEREPAPETHWTTLSTLPPGTPVRHLDGGHYMCSRIKGIKLIRGVHWLDLGGVKRRWDTCVDVRPLPPGEMDFGRRRAPADERLLDEVLRGVDAHSYCSGSTPLSIVVGSKAAVESELAGTAVRASGGTQALTLAQVVRLRVQAGLPYRADLLSATAEDLPRRAESGASVAIFDGPSAILRWRHRIRSHALVMIVDRSAPSAQAAVDAVIADRARSTRDVPGLLARIPAGIEVLAYLSRR